VTLQILRINGMNKEIEGAPAGIEPAHAASASPAMPTWKRGGFAAAPSNPHLKEMPPAGIEPTHAV